MYYICYNICIHVYTYHAKKIVGKGFWTKLPFFQSFITFLTIRSRELIQIYVIGLVHGIRCHQQAHKYVHTSGTYGLRLWYIRNFIFLFFCKNVICAWCVHILFLHIRYVKAQLCINVGQQYYWSASRTEEEPKFWKLRTPNFCLRPKIPLIFENTRIFDCGMS